MGLKKTIKFTKNWNNKLNNNVFTTIRKANYWVNDGDYCVIALDNKLHSYVKCIDKYSISIKSLNPTLLMLDTGLSLLDSYKVFKDYGLDFADGFIYVDVLTLRKMPSPDELSKEITKQFGLFNNK